MSLFHIEHSENAEDKNFIRKNLIQYNQCFALDNSAPETFCWQVRDNEGNVFGGIVGSFSSWGRCNIDLLWLDEKLRGQGFGEKLLAVVEQSAKTKGLRVLLVDTFSFQAPTFYQKMGFTIFGILEDIPPGHTRYYLKKML